MKGTIIAVGAIAVVVLVASVHARIEAEKPVPDTEPPIGTVVVVGQKFTPDTRKYICYQLSAQDPVTAKFYTPCVSQSAWQTITEGVYLTWTQEWSDSSFVNTTATPN